MGPASKTQLVPPDQAGAILRAAADRNAPLRLQLGDDAPGFKSRFLGLAEPAPPAPALWIQLPVDSRGRPAEPAPGQYCRLAFNLHRSQFFCASRIVGARMLRLAGGTDAQGLVLQWPARLEKLQRRQCYRHQFGGADAVLATLWEGGLSCREEALARERAGRGRFPLHAAGVADKMFRQPLHRGRLLNLSVGGLCVRLPAGVDPKLRLNTLVGVEFTLGPDEPTVQSDGLVRHCTGATGQVDVRLQFVGLDKTQAGRKTLDYLSRTIARLQREFLRRRHVGLD